MNPDNPDINQSVIDELLGAIKVAEGARQAGNTQDAQAVALIVIASILLDWRYSK